MFLEERTCNTATLLALKTAKATSNEAVFVHFLTFWILSHIRRLTIRVRCSLLRPLPVLRPLAGLKDPLPEPDGLRVISTNSSSLMNSSDCSNDSCR